MRQDLKPYFHDGMPVKIYDQVQPLLDASHQPKRPVGRPREDENHKQDRLMLEKKMVLNLASKVQTYTDKANKRRVLVRMVDRVIDALAHEFGIEDSDFKSLLTRLAFFGDDPAIVLALDPSINTVAYIRNLRRHYFEARQCRPLWTKHEIDQEDTLIKNRLRRHLIRRYGDFLGYSHSSQGFYLR